MNVSEISFKEMSVRYWPPQGTEKHGQISVTLQEETILSDYVIRKFGLTNKMVLKIETVKIYDRADLFVYVLCCFCDT